MRVDLAIVGAGPGGMAAAQAASRAGLDVVLIDEQPRVGGQIARQPPPSFNVPRWLAGRSYASIRTLVAAVEANPAIRCLHGCTVWGLFAAGSGGGFDLMAVHDGRGLRIEARRVVIAAGCYELPVAFPGWTLPGVMTVGAVQTLLKSQRLLPDQPVVLCGTHPLMLVVAAQLAAAGTPTHSLAFAATAGAMLRAARHPARAWRARTSLAEGAAALLATRRAGTHVSFGASLVAAEGDGHVERVRLRWSDGRESVQPCTTLATCYGFLPSSELARQAGAAHHRTSSGEWVIDTDERMRTSIPGLFAAGEVRGVAGAEVAMAEGAIAGLTTSPDGGVGLPKPRVIKRLRRTAALRRAFADELRAASTPPNQTILAMITDDTIVCRCEAVTAGAIRSVFTGHSTAADANAAKLLTRAGMGLCQGRTCEHLVGRLIAAARGQHWPQPAGFTVRAPVKPVPIGALLTQPGLGTIDPVAIERRHDHPAE